MSVTLSHTAPDAALRTGWDGARGHSENPASRTPRPRGNSPRGHADKPAWNKTLATVSDGRPSSVTAPGQDPPSVPGVQTSTHQAHALQACGAGRRRKSSVLFATADHHQRDRFQHRTAARRAFSLTFLVTQGDASIDMASGGPRSPSAHRPIRIWPASPVVLSTFRRAARPAAASHIRGPGPGRAEPDIQQDLTTDGHAFSRPARQPSGQRRRSSRRSRTDHRRRLRLTAP
jgi:hypothetical protein